MCKYNSDGARVRSQVCTCEICGGESGTGAGFSPSNSVFSCQYHSAYAPYSCQYHSANAPYSCQYHSANAPYSCQYHSANAPYSCQCHSANAPYSCQYHSANAPYSCQYHSANAPYILIFIYTLLLSEGKRSGAWESAKNQCFLGIGERWIERCFHLLCTDRVNMANVSEVCHCTQNTSGPKFEKCLW